MNILSTVMACFSILGAIDRVTGNHLKIGKEFEKGIMLLGVMAFSMVGMLLFAPVFARLIYPFAMLVSEYTAFDPSILIGMFIANDMGGTSLSAGLTSNPQIGYFNGLVVASMMGATVSFNIPFAITTIKKEYHSDVFVGILCGLGTIPIGAFVSGLILKIPMKLLFIDMIPLCVFSAIVILGLVKIPSVLVKIFSAIGKFLATVIILGLSFGIFEFLTGITIIKGMASLSEGMAVVINASAVMTGAFPLISIVSKIFNSPLIWIGRKLGLDKMSVIGIISSMATVATSYQFVQDMSKKGRIVNLAFSVSGAFVFAGHLAFTMSINPDYIFPVIVGKLTAGFSAMIVAIIVCKKILKEE